MNWWMMAYGSPTPKRQTARSNWPLVNQLDTGKLARSVQKEQTQFQTARLLEALFFECMHACSFFFPLCLAVHAELRLGHV